ncbi:MAG TPA: hypothetical protein VMO26_28425 [Vicinamibacterales bacterium]|nr:hypothetical protein [Vicinamibacterales bacterium]
MEVSSPIGSAPDVWTITAAVDDTDITELFNEVSSGRKRTIQSKGDLHVWDRQNAQD